MSIKNYETIETIKHEEYNRYGIDKNFLVDAFKQMSFIRKFEEKIEWLYLVRGSLMGPAHLYNGMEAIAVGVSKALRKGDLIVSNHRGHGHAIAIGIDPYKVMSEIFGNADGAQKGLSGSMHVAIDPEAGALYSSAIVGSQVPIAVGAAFAFKIKKTNNVVAVFFGDGAITTGALLESLNMARFLQVPIYLICEDNNYAEYTNIDTTVGKKRITEIFSAFGIKTVEVDGNDVLAVFRAIKDYEDYVRNKKAPIAIHAYTYRFSGHSVSDPANYRSKEEVEKWKAFDPILRLRNRLIDENIATKDDLDMIESENAKIVDELAERASKGMPLTLDEALKIEGDP